MLADREARTHKHTIASVNKAHARDHTIGEALLRLQKITKKKSSLKTLLEALIGTVLRVF